MSLSKYLLAGAGLALGNLLMFYFYQVAGAAYYLSQDSDEVKFDPKVHTLAKLHEVLEDVYLEYACAYIFYYNLILNMKEKKEYSDNKLESLKVQAENYTSSRDSVVAKRHGIT